MHAAHQQSSRFDTKFGQSDLDIPVVMRTTLTVIVIERSRRRCATRNATPKNPITKYSFLAYGVQPRLQSHRVITRLAPYQELGNPWKGGAVYSSQRAILSTNLWHTRRQRRDDRFNDREHRHCRRLHTVRTDHYIFAFRISYSRYAVATLKGQRSSVLVVAQS